MTFPEALDRKQRLATPTALLVALAVVLGVAWTLTELRSAPTRSWTVQHPVTVTLGTGLILLVLTVFAVERWLAWTESRRWRAPALAALDAYVHRGFEAHRRIQHSFGRLRGATTEEVIDASDPALHVERSVEAMMNNGSFHDFADVVREEMAQLATIALLTVQTVARHEPFAHVVGRISAQQGRLSSVATDAEFLAEWATYPRSVTITYPEQAEDVYMSWQLDAREVAEQMDETFVAFHTQLDWLRSQEEEATRAAEKRD